MYLSAESKSGSKDSVLHKIIQCVKHFFQPCHRGSSSVSFGSLGTSANWINIPIDCMHRGPKMPSFLEKSPPVQSPQSGLIYQGLQFQGRAMKKWPCACKTKSSCLPKSCCATMPWALLLLKGRNLAQFCAT